MNCSKCGKKIPRDATFCPGCGSQVSRDLSESKQTVQIGETVKKSRWTWIACGVALVFVIGIVVILMAVFGNSQGKYERQLSPGEKYPDEPVSASEGDAGAGDGDVKISSTEASAELESESGESYRNGNYVVFGSYEQDGNTANGPEPIEWEVLEERDGRMLLISRYILDSLPYNNEHIDVTWETCTLRKWLNDDFYNTAFTSAEQDRIQSVTVSNPDNVYCGTDGGNDTNDKLFCLSVDEIRRYYVFNSWYDEYQYGYCQDLITDMTPYVQEKGAYYDTVTKENYNDWGLAQEGYSSDVIGQGCGWWWLRSPGGSGFFACDVTYYGGEGWNFYGVVDYALSGVRPALYIEQ